MRLVRSEGVGLSFLDEVLSYWQVQSLYSRNAAPDVLAQTRVLAWMRAVHKYARLRDGAAARPRLREGPRYPRLEARHGRWQLHRGRGGGWHRGRVLSRSLRPAAGARRRTQRAGWRGRRP